MPYNFPLAILSSAETFTTVLVVVEDLATVWAPIWYLVVVWSTLLRSIVSLDQEVFARLCNAATSRTLSKTQIRNKK